MKKNVWTLPGQSSSDKQTTSEGGVASWVELVGTLLLLLKDAESDMCGRVFGRLMLVWLLAFMRLSVAVTLGVGNPPVLSYPCPLWGPNWETAGIGLGSLWDDNKEFAGALLGAGWLGISCGTPPRLEAGPDVEGL